MNETVVSDRSVDVRDAIEQLVPAATSLLSRIAGQDPYRSGNPTTPDVRLSVPILFPDAVGHGELVASLFGYRGRLRLDIVIEHDRMLATPEGVRTGTPCYLNDYQTSIMLPPGATELPVLFVQRTVAGVAAAMSAVQRYVKRSAVAWGMISVVERGTGVTRTARDAWRALGTAAGMQGSVATSWEDIPEGDGEDV